MRRICLHDENDHDDDDDEKRVGLQLCLLEERDVCQSHGCLLQPRKTLSCRLSHDNDDDGGDDDDDDGGSDDHYGDANYVCDDQSLPEPLVIG